MIPLGKIEPRLELVLVEREGEGEDEREKRNESRRKEAGNLREDEVREIERDLGGPNCLQRDREKEAGGVW